METTTDNARVPIVIGQPVVSTWIAEGGNAEVCLGIIAPGAKRLERDKTDLCDPIGASVVAESDHCIVTGIHSFRPVAG